MGNKMGQEELEQIMRRYGKDPISKADIKEFYTCCDRSLNRSISRLLKQKKVERFKPFNSNKYFYKWVDKK